MIFADFLNQTTYVELVVWDIHWEVCTHLKKSRVWIWTDMMLAWFCSVQGYPSGPHRSQKGRAVRISNLVSIILYLTMQSEVVQTTIVVWHSWDRLIQKTHS